MQRLARHQFITKPAENRRKLLEDTKPLMFKPSHTDSEISSRNRFQHFANSHDSRGLRFARKCNRCRDSPFFARNECTLIAVGYPLSFHGPRRVAGTCGLCPLLCTPTIFFELI